MTPLRLPDGRLVTVGQELTIKGWRGRYRYLGAVAKDGSLAVFGGPADRQRHRAARPDHVAIVHRSPKLRPN